MTEPVPRWIMIKYALLWRSFKGNAFDHTQATALLGDKLVSVTLSILKKRGWLTISLHPKDSRKRLYTLKSPEAAIGEMSNE